MTSTASMTCSTRDSDVREPAVSGFAARASRRLWSCALCASSALMFLVPWSVSAQLSPSAASDAMFRAGKQHLAAQDYAQACPLFAESHRLEPATGTLLALAMCHERAGMLDDAQRAYHEVLMRSQREGRVDRVNAAREKIGELAQLIAMRDATRAAEQPAAQQPPAESPVSVPEPESSVAPSAREPIAVASAETPAPDTSPALAVAPRPTRATPAPRRARIEVSSAPSTRTRHSDDDGVSLMKISAIASMGLGGVGLVIAGVFTAQAVADNNAAQEHCNGDLCNPTGWKHRVDARAAGTHATIAGALGAAAVATGLVLYLLDGGDEGADARAVNGRGVRAQGYASPDGMGAALTGTF